MVIEIREAKNGFIIHKEIIAFGKRYVTYVATDRDGVIEVVKKIIDEKQEKQNNGK